MDHVAINLAGSSVEAEHTRNRHFFVVIGVCKRFVLLKAIPEKKSRPGSLQKRCSTCSAGLGVPNDPV